MLAAQVRYDQLPEGVGAAEGQLRRGQNETGKFREKRCSREGFIVSNLFKSTVPENFHAPSVYSVLPRLANLDWIRFKDKEFLGKASKASYF